MIWDYLFCDNESGEEFFVECETKEEAISIARYNFEDPELICRCTPFEADLRGLDTY